jgi:hypothetical protein
MPGLKETSAPFRSGRGTGVQASVTKAHFSWLLAEVKRGQTIVILRHGKPRRLHRDSA